MRERVDNVNDYEAGQEIKVGDMFQAGDRVDVSGVSRGKGYQELLRGTDRESPASLMVPSITGVLARWVPAPPHQGLSRGKLPGHKEVENVTVQNLSVVRVDSERNLLLLKGSVPGIKGGFLEIKKP